MSDAPTPAKKPRVESAAPPPPRAGAGASSSAPALALDLKVLQQRVRPLTRALKVVPGGAAVVYYMSRDQRAEDNWAMLYARHLAAEHGVALHVVFNLVPEFLDATVRQFGFMLKGLAGVESSLRAKNIPFHLLRGTPENTVVDFCQKVRAAALVCDMSPLRMPTHWTRATADRLQDAGIPVFQVDAHNIVPVWVASEKKEVGARTLRPKIHAHLPKFLNEFPVLAPNDVAVALPVPVDWAAADATLTINRTVAEVTWAQPGAAGAEAQLAAFGKRIARYDDKRNDPTVDAQSGLSPWLHFGQIAAQRVVLSLKRDFGKSHASAVAAWVEEGVVRRELSDNFCFYEPNYDSLAGAAQWARDSLELHASDKREYTYTLAQFETGKTHDTLWNAAQLQMVHTGRMHGFMRMYWAKKILEWTATPAQALDWANFLNNKYQLDGRDPSGYVGVAWSIMGTHDMGWAERAVFGKIRFMNHAGCKRKFKVDVYVAQHTQAPVSGAKAKAAAAARS